MGCIESVHNGLTSAYNVYDRMPQLAEYLDYNSVETHHYNCMVRYKRKTLRRRHLRKTHRNIENSEPVIQLSESKIIQQEQLTTNLTTEILKRSSSFADDICIHCEHKHLFNCCQYYYDTVNDALDYAEWKINLEKFRTIDIVNVTCIPEAICGNFSPIGFPGYTHKHPKDVFFGIPKRNFTLKIPFLWLRKLIFCFRRNRKQNDQKQLIMSQDEKDYLEMSLRTKDFKLDNLLAEEDTTPKISEEWGSGGGGWSGPEIIVEIQETTATDLTKQNMMFNSTEIIEGPKIIVRAEEILIVLFVLLLWVGAIALFFNRWGKIRMLEPYQPKFQQQHRTSCPLVDIESLDHPRTSISRMSMGLAVPCQFSSFSSSARSRHPEYFRPRQNSVFVSSAIMLPKQARKTRSAMDLHSIILDESAEQV